MARKTKETLGFAPFKEVIQIPLWETFEQDVETYLADETDIMGSFLNLASVGYSVSLEQDGEGGYQAKVRDLDRTRLSAGLMFYANADNPIECMAIAVVKEHFLGRGKDWTIKASTTTRKKWR